MKKKTFFPINKNNLIAEQSVEWCVLSTEFEQSVSDQLKSLVKVQCLHI